MTEGASASFFSYDLVMRGIDMTGSFRRTDPETSALAAARTNVEAGRAKVLAALRDGPKTGWDIARFCGEARETEAAGDG
jgi:hypothetical protein